MENRIALVGIIVEDGDSVMKVNNILHDYNKFIIGRMGVPHRERGLCIISIVVDATTDITSALSGKLGAVPGVSTKTIYSKI
ncbi:MAG: iron-only hydrogenase system regulator [Clostridiales bacterium]|nr:MAG: iron-only hydrogenase system regulator [Clostridiales bacterium]